MRCSRRPRPHAPRAVPSLQRPCSGGCSNDPPASDFGVSPRWGARPRCLVGRLERRASILKVSWYLEGLIRFEPQVGPSGGAASGRTCRQAACQRPTTGPKGSLELPWWGAACMAVPKCGDGELVMRQPGRSPFQRTRVWRYLMRVVGSGPQMYRVKSDSFDEAASSGCCACLADYCGAD